MLKLNFRELTKKRRKAGSGGAFARARILGFGSSGFTRRGLVVVAGALIALVAAQTPAKGIPAFPGAEGFGAKSVGGRGGRIIEVTNLNAKGPGSLRAACEAKGPRIVVFKVSGIITGNVYVVGEPFITIAGQTAPGDGICIRRGKLLVGTHDVIIRYLRVRPGDHPAGPGGENRDCLGIAGAGDRVYNVIVDHCSFSWGTDENVCVWDRARDVTIQWCISSEALHDSIHPKGPHSNGMILGYRENSVSIHHCLLAHNHSRNPLINAEGKSKTPPTYDYRNNVTYDYDAPWYGSIRGNSLLNYVGNLIKMGPSSFHKPSGIAVIATSGQPRIYVKDNVWVGKLKGEVEESRRELGEKLGPNCPPLMGTSRLESPAPAAHVATQPAADAYESVLDFAGCTRPVRDVVDARVIAEVRSGTGRLIDSQKDVGGWPTYASPAPPADTDRDGMPDAWEKKHGFDPNDPADGPKDRDGDGYTNVEEYLNLTDPAKADTGAPVAQTPVTVQAGNDRIRGEAARKIGEQRMADARRPKWNPRTREAFIRKVKESGKEVGDYLGVKFVKIPAGKLKMSRVTITLSRPFEMSACEITQGQWETVMGTRPWEGQPFTKNNPEFPVTHVNYVDCQEFLSRLNACRGRKYRLPTSAEWKHAASGGTDSPFGFGRDKRRVPEYAWCSLKYHRRKDGSFGRRYPKAPQAVGKLKPNPYGLYNMAGNVCEWCHDWYGYRYYYRATGAGLKKTDPMGPKTGYMRRVCGGNFSCRPRAIIRYPSSNHYAYFRNYGLGFRLHRGSR